MKEQQKLTLQMFILFIIVFVFFGVIVTTEKLAPLRIPKVEQKMQEYLNKNYKDEKISLQEVEYKELRYQAKVISKANKNYYFYIYYKDKKITDTYKKDYLEGKTIITYQQKTIEKNINKKTSRDVKVNILKKLNEYNDSDKKLIIKSKHPENLPIYNLEIEVNSPNFTIEQVFTVLTNVNNNLNEQSIKPSSYTFIVNNESNSKKLQINNITPTIVENEYFGIIISDIISNKKSNLVSSYNITYKYI